MDRRSLVGFVLLNIMVTFLVAFLIIGITGYLRPAQIPPSTPLVMIVTVTPDPRETPKFGVTVVTATPSRVGGIEIQPTPTAGGASQPTTLGAPPLPETLLPTGIGPTETLSATPTDSSGCPTTTLQAGENPSIIASRYKVSLDDLLAANGLTQDSSKRLQPGQKLILPIQGCGVPTATVSPTASPTKVPNTATPPPTSTEVVTALPTTKSRLDIVQIIAPGDITMEGLELENVSNANIEMGGWKLKDKQGVAFTFPDLTMYAGRRIVLFTREGANTPLNLFWGRSRAMWGDPSQVITITDANNQVQLTYSISGGSSVVVSTPTRKP